MYQKGDLIVYSSSGVCRVEEIGPLKGAGGVKEVREYYTLSPVFGSGVIYIPSDTGMFMRPVLTKEQVESLIDRIPTLEGDTCDISTLRALSEQYHAAFESHRCENLLRLIKALYLKEQNSVRQGRRVGLTEMKYRKHAEELIHGEFSVALGIPVEEVPNYISARLSNDEQQKMPVRWTGIFFISFGSGGTVSPDTAAEEQTAPEPWRNWPRRGSGQRECR